MTADYKKYTLDFKRPAGTSRGIMDKKETWFLRISEAGKAGYGECGILRGLSVDDRPDYEDHLRWVCENIHLGEEELYFKMEGFPSIQFGIEMAFRSFRQEDPFELFRSGFTEGKQGIDINGLIWMGEAGYMQKQIETKIESGFKCIKMKIGAIDFDTELELLKGIRKRYSPDKITLRVDANGAFSPKEAMDKLNRLAKLDLHSIEQPIAAGQEDEMARLCEESPLPIALDEELLGIYNYDFKKNLIQKLMPHYLILKPSLIGGFRGSNSWIQLAEEQEIGWWITSALESNLGLNAIAQYTFGKKPQIPQGLGTGGLYTNNVSSPLEIRNGELRYDPEKDWSFQF